MRMIRPLRVLFDSLGLDVVAYSDDAIVEGILTICPDVDPEWPSDQQLRRVAEYLDRRRTS